MAPKIKDIASFLNISPATVSMALNDRPGVNQRTRDSVLDAARKLEYQPSSNKRALAEGIGTLPLIIYRKHGKIVSETPFFSSLIESIEKEAKSNGFRLGIHYLDGNSPSAKEELRGNVCDSGCGFLLQGTEMCREDLDGLIEDLPPYVLIDNAMTGLSVDKVLMNNFEGAYSAVQALLSLGHRDIGCMHSKVWISNFAERFAGYRSAMASAGLEPKEEWIVRLDSTHDGAYCDMRSFLERRPALPSAFFSDNDLIAMGAMKALKEFGIGIPETVSIIGFDDIPFSAIVEPGLSTMRVDMPSIGRAAVQLLLQGNPCARKIELDTKLIMRASTKTLG